MHNLWDYIFNVNWSYLQCIKYLPNKKVTSSVMNAGVVGTRVFKEYGFALALGIICLLAKDSWAFWRWRIKCLHSIPNSVTKFYASHQPIKTLLLFSGMGLDVNKIYNTKCFNIPTLFRGDFFFMSKLISFSYQLLLKCFSILSNCNFVTFLIIKEVYVRYISIVCEDMIEWPIIGVVVNRERLN